MVCPQTDPRHIDFNTSALWRPPGSTHGHRMYGVFQFGSSIPPARSNAVDRSSVSAIPPWLAVVLRKQAEQKKAAEAELGSWAGPLLLSAEDTED